MRKERLLCLIVLGTLLNASTAEANVSWNMALFYAPQLWWTIPATLAIETPAYKALEQRSWNSAVLLTLRVNVVSFLIGLILFIPLPSLLQMFSLVFVGNVLIESIAFKRCRPGMLGLRNIWILVAANGISTAIPFLQWSLSK